MKQSVEATLLSDSVSLYESMLARLQVMSQELNGSGLEVLENFNREFATLQQQVMQVDGQVLAEISPEEIAPEQQPLWQRRLDLQQQTLALLKETVGRAISVKSLLAEEMRSLKQGRQAMNGYKNMAVPQRKIISSSF